VLALLALGCFPVLAQADSSGIQYSDAPPTATGNNTIPTRSEPPAHSSKADGGDTAPDNAGSGASSGGKASAGGSSESGAASGAANGGGTGKQGNPGQGSAGGSDNSANPAVGSGEAASSQSDDGSSPLVPVLIAIAVLAAISIGAVIMRRRRGSGTSVSPEAS
jgi:cobalamin biosynthesis Mg chelatase CobN